jgi:nitroreductase
MIQPSLLSYISERYSPFAFSREGVDEQKLKIMFEAAGKAPSTFNNQPWYFLYGSKREPDKYALFFECINDVNKKWAQSAPVLALNVARDHYVKNGRKNPYALYETGMATANMLIQALSMGIYIHQMGGYDKEMDKKLLKIPEGFEPLAMMAMGYPADPVDLPEEIQERATKRTGRRPVEEFVFSGEFISGK